MENLFAQRLSSTRKMGGFSLQELANNIDNVITKQALSKYEKGLMKPDSKIIIKLAKALNIKVDYFFRKKEVELKDVEFRKKASLTKKKRESIERKTADFLERYIELETILNKKSEYINPLEGTYCSKKQDVELAAERLRQLWNLGSNPIPNVLDMLEDKGLKVLEFPADSDFNGLSTWVEKYAVIVVNSNLEMLRKRFTALHELAHLFLKFSEELEEKEIEKLCHNFAGALLLPKESLFDEIGGQRKRFALKELIALKEEFGISIQAIVARAYSLDLIDRKSYDSFWIQWTKMGFRLQEPGNYIGREHSTRFQQLILHAAAEDIISINKAASLADQPLAEFQRDFVVLA